MSDATRIQKLFEKGYKQAAFTKKSNAQFFEHLWNEHGYETEIVRSSGPTLESNGKRVIHAYYVIAHKSVHGQKENIVNKILGKF